MQGNIEQRGRDTWRLRVYLGRHPQTGAKRYVRRTVHGTKRAAELALAALVVEVGRGFHAAEDHTVAELVGRWLNLVEPDLSPATARDYRYVLASHITPGLGALNIARVRPAELDAWYRTLDVGAARVRRVHNMLSCSFDQAVRWQWIASNPCDHARPPKVVQREIVPPAYEDVRRLHELALDVDPDLACYVHVAAATGARRGELVALRWSDVDLDQAVIVIARSAVAIAGGVAVKRTKTNETRTVAIADDTVAVLRTQRARQRERAFTIGVRLEDGPVFTSDPAGSTAWYPSSVSRRFRKLAQRAGLEGIRLHDLRHFVATQMLANGVDYRTVAGVLGHRQPATLLNRYAHFVPAAGRVAAEEHARRMGG